MVKAGKKRNCVIGKSCGASCINKKKTCRVDAKKELSEGLTNASGAIQSTAAPDSKLEGQKNKVRKHIRGLRESLEESRLKIKELENNPGYTSSHPVLTSINGVEKVIARYQAQYNKLPKVTTWEAKNLKSRLNGQIRSLEKLESRLKVEAPLLYQVRMERKALERKEGALKYWEGVLNDLPKSAYIVETMLGGS